MKVSNVRNVQENTLRSDTVMNVNATCAQFASNTCTSCMNINDQNTESRLMANKQSNNEKLDLSVTERAEQTKLPRRKPMKTL